MRRNERVRVRRTNVNKRINMNISLFEQFEKKNAGRSGPYKRPVALSEFNKNHRTYL